jgi:hypothetical protein
VQSLQALIADPLSMYMDPSVQQSVFGTIDPAEIADLYRAWCLTHLGRDIAEAWLWSVSVGCVAAVVLRDGRRVVIKAHQPDRDQHRLSAIATIQALACGIARPETADRAASARCRMGSRRRSVGHWAAP